jgi:hypothetical protein
VLRWLATLLGALAIVALLALGVWSYLTRREAPPEESSYAFDLSEIRALAGRLEGPLPLRVRSEVTGESALPRAAVFAGESFDPHPILHQVFQIVFPHGYVLVDGGCDEEYLMASMRGGSFHGEGYAAVQASIGGARSIVITHEHGDHLQGPGPIPAGRGSRGPTAPHPRAAGQHRRPRRDGVSSRSCTTAPASSPRSSSARIAGPSCISSATGAHAVDRLDCVCSDALPSFTEE